MHREFVKRIFALTNTKHQQIVLINEKYPKLIASISYFQFYVNVIF